MAPYEALLTASIGDVFFVRQGSIFVPYPALTYQQVHERGFRVAIWNFAIGGNHSFLLPGIRLC